MCLACDNKTVSEPFDLHFLGNPSFLAQIGIHFTHLTYCTLSCTVLYCPALRCVALRLLTYYYTAVSCCVALCVCLLLTSHLDAAITFLSYSYLPYSSASLLFIRPPWHSVQYIHLWKSHSIVLLSSSLGLPSFATPTRPAPLIVNHQTSPDCRRPPVSAHSFIHSFQSTPSPGSSQSSIYTFLCSDVGA